MDAITSLADAPDVPLAEPVEAPARAGRRAGDWVAGLLLPAIILGGWELASHLHWVKPVFLPTPEATVTAFFTMIARQDFLQDFLSSIRTVSQGFLYGAVLGLILGAAAGLSRAVERFLGPTFDAIRQIPAIAWLPLIVLWLGIGPVSAALHP